MEEGTFLRRPPTSENGPELTSRDVRDVVGLGSSAFKPSTAAVSMSLAGSCFSSGDRTKKPMMEKMRHLLDREPMELPMQNDACNWRRHRTADMLVHEVLSRNMHHRRAIARYPICLKR
jgi:hypothetical protein